MSQTRAAARAWLGAALWLGGCAQAFALPTMIRLGYPNCAACHVAPQGGGVLNDYGRAIDEAQSLRASEYKPSENPLLKGLSFGGRVQQDLRIVMSDQGVFASHGPSTNVPRVRLMYRNVTNVGAGLRVSATATGDTNLSPRPPLRYDPQVVASTVTVNTALVHVRASPSVELAAGKDQLPTGLNIPDLGALFKSRNRYGYYDAPVQLKASVGGKRYQVMPFVYGPGGNEPAGEREAGVGTLAEVDVLGQGRTVAGVSLLRGGAANGDRRMMGGYVRLGFGRWGLLAEHDLTDRTRESVAIPADSFRQQASYAQLFVAVREWLVTSVIGERLIVDAPFPDRLVAGKLEVAARLTNQAAVGVSARVQRNQRTDAWGTSAMVQLALKTAQ